MIKSKHLLRPIAAGVLALASPFTAAAQDNAQATQSKLDPAAITIAQEILALGIPEQTREAVFFATMDQMMAQMKDAALQARGLEDPEVIAIMDKHLAQFRLDAQAVLRSHLPAIMDGWAKAYANMFTLQELADIRTFVRTPSGQRYFQLGPAVMAEPHFAQANQAYMNEVMQLTPSMQEALKADLLEYLANEQGARSTEG